MEPLVQIFFAYVLITPGILIILTALFIWIAPPQRNGQNIVSKGKRIYVSVLGPSMLIAGLVIRNLALAGN